MSIGVESAIEDRRSQVLSLLMEFVRQPSVSADPAFEAGMAGARAQLLARLRALGLDGARELRAGGHPAIYAEWLGAPERPTILIYGHYDVQPPAPLDRWLSPPFEPTLRDGRLYGRGTSDTKATVIIAIETIGAYLRAGNCPVNIKLLIEGEEEIGSPSLREMVRAHRELLDADAVLSADGGRASVRVPTVSTGTRGMVKVEVVVRSAVKDLHSGRYGGATRNALHELSKLIASLHDDQGRILVSDFLTDIAPPSRRDRADALVLAQDDDDLLASVGVSPHGDPDYSVRERLTLRPTIEVNGMWGGYIGPGSKTIIPAEANAKITIRLAPGQDPVQAEASLRRHLKTLCPAGVTIDVTRHGGVAAAYTLEDSHPMLRAAERVMLRLFGQRAVRARGGGTLPVTALFKEELGIDTLRFAFGMPDEDVHAPNEFFRLSSLDEGLMAWTWMLAELGALSSSDFDMSKEAVS